MRYDDVEEQKQYAAEEPWIYRQHPVPHYYGDTVRQLMLFTAAVLLVGAPFYASDLVAELPVIVFAALIMVCLAAFTSPISRTVLLADAVVAGVGMVLFELWALSALSETSLVAVGLRQAIALFLMFALYFSGKTLRGLSEPDWKTLEDEKEAEAEERTDTEEEEDAREFDVSGGTMRESFRDKDD